MGDDDDVGFGALDSFGAGGKKKKKTEAELREEKAKAKAEADAKLTFKGKPSSFFIMDHVPGDTNDPYGHCRVPTQEQMLFIYQHYPM